MLEYCGILDLVLFMCLLVGRSDVESGLLWSFYRFWVDSEGSSVYSLYIFFFVWRSYFVMYVYGSYMLV